MPRLALSEETPDPKDHYDRMSLPLSKALKKRLVIKTECMFYDFELIKLIPDLTLHQQL